MLCSDFEDQLTDYIGGVASPEASKLIAEHSLRCPVCHELLAAVRSTVEACRVAPVPSPSRELEARILQRTVPESSMSCSDFEEFLTDYLDGFLPAHLYHRWERHAALCDRCTEPPGEIVCAILVLTNPVSADGSIGGVYNASLQLAEQTSGKAKTEVEEITNTSPQPAALRDDKPVPPPSKDGDQQKDQNKSSGNVGGSNNR